MSEMISFGAGVNSVAMTILLVNEGWRGPIVFADTGCELPETYCYIRYFEQGWLNDRGMKIIRISPATHPELYKDKRIHKYTTLEQFCLHRKIVPLGGTKWCSIMFKGNGLDAWRKINGYTVSLRGITIDEPNRVKGDSGIQYPLVDRGINRQECARIIQRAGLEVPIKSGCFCCPGAPLSAWKWLYHEHPDLYERAAQMERNAAQAGQKWSTLDPHGQSLDEMKEKRWVGQIEMDLSRWMPCICSL